MAAQIAHFKSVVVMENVLYAYIPLHRSRGNLVRDIAGTCGAGLRYRQVPGRGHQFAVDAAVGEERSVFKDGGEVHGVVRDTLLRRIGGAADVIEDDVVCHAEARADRGPAAGSRRIGDTQTRRKSFVVRGRSLKGDQAG